MLQVQRGNLGTGQVAAKNASGPTVITVGEPCTASKRRAATPELAH